MSGARFVTRWGSLSYDSRPLDFTHTATFGSSHPQNLLPQEQIDVTLLRHPALPARLNLMIRQHYRKNVLAHDAQAKLALIVAQCLSICVSVRDSLSHAYAA